MADAARVVLVADTAQALPLVARLLGDEFEIRGATTWDDAVRCLGEQPHVAIVGYHFDGMRPYRLLQKIREEDDACLGVVVIRAAPLVPHGADEKEIEESYRQLGADTYLVLDKTARGEQFVEASARLRSAVRRLFAPPHQ
jgi:PleD family two-component response regulator